MKNKFNEIPLLSWHMPLGCGLYCYLPTNSSEIACPACTHSSPLMSYQQVEPTVDAQENTLMNKPTKDPAPLPTAQKGLAQSRQPGCRGGSPRTRLSGNMSFFWKNFVKIILDEEIVTIANIVQVLPCARHNPKNRGGGENMHPRCQDIRKFFDKTADRLS